MIGCGLIVLHNWRATTWAPKKIDHLGGQPSKIPLEQARVRSVFTQASSLCLAPWDIWKSLKYCNHAKFIQLQQLIPNHLKLILKFGRNPQGCMQRPQGKAPCFKLSADTRNPAGRFCLCGCLSSMHSTRKKLQQHDWNLLDMRSIFFSGFLLVNLTSLDSAGTFQWRHCCFNVGAFTALFEAG